MSLTATGCIKLAVATALLLSLGVPQAFAQAPVEKLTKKQVSANGLYTVYLREHPDKSCRVIVTKDGNPHWQLEQCVGSTSDLYFVSNDGESFWVLHTLAEKKKLKKKKKGSWTGSVVAVLYDREGRKRSTRTAGSLVPKIGYPEIRELAGHVMWLEGVSGIPGKPPRVNDKNQLEFETVGPGYIKLAFELDKEKQ